MSTLTRTGLVIALCSLTGCAYLESWWSDNKPELPDIISPTNSTPASDILAQAVIHTAPESVRSWPIVSTLTISWRGGDLYCDLDDWSKWPAPDGTIGNVWVFLFRDGKWHGGPCDGFRPPTRNFRSKRALCVPEGDKQLYVPQSGETIKVMLSGPCRKGKGMKPAQRSSIAEIVWP